MVQMDPTNLNPAPEKSIYLFVVKSVNSASLKMKYSLKTF